MQQISRQEALDYHEGKRPGKLKIVPTKPMSTQRDLALAYSPGVGEPVEEIARDPSLAYRYTAKGNLVGVISNGSAILGLGNRGGLASKPVMEGKAVLFKRFADIDVFDLELATQDADEVINFIVNVAPTFGGINLEDIKAPECFYIEEILRKELDIPVFHDDQHGTAIISGAGLLNALEVVDKQLDEVSIVINGAGASGLACAEFFIALGAQPDNIVLCDTRGVIYEGRTEGMNIYKKRYASRTSKRTLREAVNGADVFIGLSAKGAMDVTMVRSMARDPIIFAMANPDPEIDYDLAKSARTDTVVMGTGRSDYPNMVNNVLGFPFIFRGALDVHASAINMEMKIAAARALAELTKEDVPDSVLAAYGLTSLVMGPEYVLPKPLDPRVLMWVAPAVAQAAMESGVARRMLDMDDYLNELTERLGKTEQVMRFMQIKATRDPKRLVFAEGNHTSIVRAAHSIEQAGIAKALLLGNQDHIRELCDRLKLDFEPEVLNPADSPALDEYIQVLYEARRRKGVTLTMAREMMLQENYFGSMMVRTGYADAFISGLTYNYPDVLRPALQVVGVMEDREVVSGVYLMIVNDQLYFFSDATVNINPGVEELASIAINAADVAVRFDVEPRIAMISYSNFGSTRGVESDHMRAAAELVKERRPDLTIDGEMQADIAVEPDLMARLYPFSEVSDANVLIFPSLSAANASYKLVNRLGDADKIGPILVGLRRPVHVLESGAEVRDIVNMATVAVVESQALDAGDEGLASRMFNLWPIF